MQVRCIFRDAEELVEFDELLLNDKRACDKKAVRRALGKYISYQVVALLTY